MNWLIRFYLRNDLEKWKPAAYLAVLACAVILVSSCSPAARKAPVVETNMISYARDDRTDLCFAVYSYAEYAAKGMTMTHVPCTPAVLKMIR